MANGISSGSVSVPVNLELKVLQSSLAEFKKVLAGLEPNTSGYRKLSQAIQEAERHMERLQLQGSKPFMNQTQFTQAEKTVETLEDDFIKMRNTVEAIKFSDLKLTPEQTQSIKDYTDRIEQLKNNLKGLKDSEKLKLLEDQDFKDLEKVVNTSFLDKSLDAIQRTLNNKKVSLEKEADDLATKLNETLSKIGQFDIQKNINQNTGLYRGSGTNRQLNDVSLDSIIGFNKNNGAAYYKHGKSAGSQQLVEYLTELYSLTPEQQKEVLDAAEKSIAEVQKLILSKDYFKYDTKAHGQAETTKNDIIAKQAQNQAAQAAVARGIGSLSQAQTNVEVGAKQIEKQLELEKQGLEGVRDSAILTAQNINALGNAHSAANVQLDSFKQTLASTNAEFLKQQARMNSFNSIKMAITNFMGFNQILNLTRRAVTAAINHIKQLDTTMNAIAVVTDMTTADLWEQVDAYTAIAQKYGITIQGAYEVSKIYYQAGYDTNEVLTLTNETLKLSKIAALDYATTTDYMMTAMRGFKLEMEDASRVVDVYSNLASHTAVSQAELAEAMTRTASSMESVGASFEETSAMIATMVAVTRESANNIGSAMKSIASRYGELKKGQGELVDENGEIVDYNKVDTALKSVGITLKDTNGEFRNFTDVIIELASKWDTLNSVQQRYIATQFAGNRQQSRFLALVSNIELLQENIENAENAEGVGDIQAATTLEGLEAKINQVNVALQEFYTTLGIESAWKSLLDRVKNVLNTLNEMPKLFGKIPAAALIVVMNIINLVKSVLLKGVQNLATVWVQALNNAKKDTEASAQEQQKSGENWINNFITGIKSGASNMKNVITTIKKDATNAFNKEEFGKAQTALGKAKQMETGFATGFEGGSLLAAAESQFANLGKYGAGKKGSSFKNDSQQLLAEYNSLISVCEQYGIKVNKNITTLRELKAAYQELIPELKNKEAALRQESSAAEDAAKKEALLAEQQQNMARQKFANSLQQVASGLSTLALLFNDGSRAGELFSGYMQMAAGAVYAFTAAWSTNPVGAVITGLTFLVTGLSTIIETTEEKIERLSGEAEELQQIATQTKSDQKALEKSIETYEKLQKTRYESAEAAEEYQTAVDELASKYPELINGIDELGNVTINEANLETTLAKAREATAKATLNAANAEIKSLEEKIKAAKDDVNKAQSNSERNLQVGTFLKTANNGGYSKINAPETNKQILIRALYSEGIDGASDNLIDAYQKYIEAQFANENSTEETYKNLVIAARDFAKLLPQPEGQEESYSSLISDELIAKTWEEFQALKALNDELRGQEKIAILSKVDSQFADNQVAQEAIQNKGLRAFIAQDVYNDIGGRSWEDYLSGENNLYTLPENWVTFYNNLSSANKKLFDKMFSEADKYGAEDFIDAFKDLSPELQEVVKSYFQESSDYYKKQIQNLGYKFEQDKHQEITKQDWQFYSQIDEEADEMMESGLKEKTETYREAMTNVFNSLTKPSSEGIDNKTLKTIESTILENGITTKEGIQASIDFITSLNLGDAGKAIIEGLEGARDSIVENIALSVQTEIESIKTAAEDVIELLGKTKDSISSFEEMDKVIKSASNLGIDLDYSDFEDLGGGKYGLSADNYLIYYQAIIDKYSNITTEAVEKAKTVAENLIDKDKKTVTSAFEKFLTDDVDELKESTATMFRWFGLNISDFYDENGKKRENIDFSAVYTQLNDFVDKGYLVLQQLAEKIVDKAKKQVWSEGIYSDAINKFYSELTEAEKEEVKYFNESYNTILSDIMSKGTEYVIEHFSDYKGIQDRGVLLSAIETNSNNYQSIVRSFAKNAALTTQEYNSYIVEAIQKDSNLALKDALSDVDFYSKDVAKAGLETVQKIADILHVSIDEIIGKYDPDNNQYYLDFSEDSPLKNIDLSKYSSLVADSQASIVKAISDYYSAALEGNLGSEDKNKFIKQLSDFSIGTENLVFTDINGNLQLSVESAIKLYNELSNVKGVAGSITLDTLQKQLAKINKQYETQTGTLQRITELEKEIATLPQNDAKRKQYEEELKVAKQIRDTRLMTDSQDYNFMKRGMPGGAKNAISYLEYLGQVSDLYQTATKDGRIGLEDAYTLAEAINYQAEVTGQAVTYLGVRLNGGAESLKQAYSKIASASTIYGGKAVLDFKSMGVEFIEGADEAGNDFMAGYKDFAQKQADMYGQMADAMDAMAELEEGGGTDDEQKEGLLTKFLTGLGIEEDSKDFNLYLDTIKTNYAEFIEYIANLPTDQLSSPLSILIGFLGVVEEKAKGAAQATENLNDATQNVGNGKGKGGSAKSTSTSGQTHLGGPQEVAFEGSDGGGNGHQEQKPETTITIGIKYGEDVPEGLRQFIEATAGDLFRSLLVNSSANGTSPLASILNGETALTYDQAVTIALASLLLSMQQGKTPDTSGLQLDGYDLGGLAGTPEGTIASLLLFAAASGLGISNTSENALSVEGKTVATTGSPEAVVSMLKAVASVLGITLTGSVNIDGKETSTDGIPIGTILQLAISAASNGVDLTGEIDVGGKKVNIGGTPEGYVTQLLLELSRKYELDTRRITLQGQEIPLGEVVGKVQKILGEYDPANSEYATPMEYLKAKLGSDLGLTSEITLNDLISAIAQVTSIIGQNATQGELQVNTDNLAYSNTIDLKTLIAYIALLSGAWTNNNPQYDWTNVLPDGDIDLGTRKAVVTINGIQVKKNTDLGFQVQAKKDPDLENLTLGEIQASGGWDGTSWIAGGDPRTFEYRTETKRIIAQTASLVENNSEVKESFDAWKEAAIKFTQETISQEDYQAAENAFKSSLSNAGVDVARLSEGLQTTSGRFASLLDTIPKQIDVNVEVKVDASVDGGGGGGRGTAVITTTKAKGTQTLMGELGPELYVTGGHYYVAGQNGAEFVSLPDDAIVFNHLQTQRLLKNGSSGRGKAVTNEKKATSFATGNVSGPALASAREAANQLRKIQQQWQAIVSQSFSDLASMAGKKGGGGGGGSSKDNGDRGYITDLERWYNLLRQIEKLQRDINYEEKLRSKIESDRIINGTAIYESQKRQLKALDEEIEKHKELARLQRSYYQSRVADLNATQYSKIFTFTEDGLMQYNDNAIMKNGDQGGLAALSKLNAIDINGSPVLDYKQQYNLLATWGFGNEMLYDTTGKKMNSKDKDYYKNSIKNFWDKLDAWKEELDGLYDSYNEQLEDVLDNEENRNKILQEIVDNQISLENQVLKAIEDREQRAIDEAKDEREALQDSADKFIDGLTDQLEKERNMYEKQETQNETDKLRRQLAILQRSGGSASQIRNLQNELTNRDQDAYFQAQQDQIDAVKEASDLQLERLDKQIDLMEETLEYQKAYGLLWNEVYQVMDGTEQSIYDFITGNTTDWSSKSILNKQEETRTIISSIQQWLASRDDENNPLGNDTHNWDTTREALGKMTEAEEEVAKKAFEEEYARTADPNAAQKAAEDALNKMRGVDYDKNAQEKVKQSGKDSQSSKTSNSSKKGQYRASYDIIGEYEGSQTSKEHHYFFKKSKEEAEKEMDKRIKERLQVLKKKNPSISYYANGKSVVRYANGGLIDFTGPAWVDGTKSRPEGILNAEQLDLLRNSVLTTRNPLTNILTEYTDLLNSPSAYDSIPHGDSVNIGNIAVNMNVARLANDYDARRAADATMEEIVKIARKSTVNNVSRR